MTDSERAMLERPAHASEGEREKVIRLEHDPRIIVPPPAHASEGDEPEREPDAYVSEHDLIAQKHNMIGAVTCWPAKHLVARRDPVEVYFHRPPTSASEGAEGSFGGVEALDRIVREGRGALEIEFGLTEHGDVGVWWTGAIEDAPDAVGDTVDEALYRLLAAPPEPESED